jgi:segregation and condensation protein B
VSTQPELETERADPAADGNGPAVPEDTPADAPLFSATDPPGPDAAASESGAPGAASAPPGSAGPDPAIEALLFASEGPLAAHRLAQLAGVGKAEALSAVDRLNVFYAESRRSFRIVPLAGGFQLVTTPEHASVVSGLHKEKPATKLSRAALETLSIIAFKQPVTRAEIDLIRGVSASDGVLRHLMERQLVRIAGRAEAPGRPLLYGTTREFLAHFGLNAISDLPRTDELATLLAGDRAAPPAEPDTETLVVETLPPEPAAPVRPAWDDGEDDEDEKDEDLHARAREGSRADDGDAAPQ